MFYRPSCASFLFTLLLTAYAAAEEPLFPFVVAYDAPANLTNVADLLERPAGQRGFVHAENERLVVGEAGATKPIRFWATNICFDACFPSHDQAQRLAARLARLGINCVRLHHMDNHSIWGDSPDHVTIDPKRLERLDYLIAQFKRHGIYVDVNLHVSRWFDETEGFVARQQRPNYDKGLDNFEPRMIELQKKYARDLLTHVNPYTENSYATEPAVAFVEINNENALFSQWSWGQLDNLPEPYATTFRKTWNAWLRKKYADTATLRRAWKASDRPLEAEMIATGDFARTVPGHWQLENDDQTKAGWTLESGGPNGRRELKLVVARVGSVAWHPQLTEAGFGLKKDSPYTLTFYARAATARRMSVNCMMAHDPWEELGLWTELNVGTAWKQYRYTFLADRDDAKARLTFSSFKPGTYELAAVSLRPGGTAGIDASQRIEDDTVHVLRHDDLGSSADQRNDFTDFIYDTERSYWSGMYRFLKDELGVRSLVSGTQLGYSPVGIQSGLDYIDAHAYWNHPQFPGRDWDSRNWTIRNTALVNSPGGTLSELAAWRVAGMPFTVSEYNHPQPIVYAGEGLPMIAAFGAFQSWDAIFSFAYSHDQDFEPRRIPGFFDVKSVTPQIVHMPVCAAMFVRGDVAPARAVVLAAVSAEGERSKLHETRTAWRLNASEFGMDAKQSLLHGLAMSLGKGNAFARAIDSARIAKDAIRFVSDTGELCWDVAQPGEGYFTVNTPRSKLFTGFVRGRSFDLDGVGLKIGATRLDWATLSLVCRDGAGFNRPGRILVAATGLAQNQGARLQHFVDDKVSLGDQWGKDPVLCEGVAAEILLPVAADRVWFYPLDESGRRRAALPVEGRGAKTLLRLGPQHRTVWYEVEVR
ncbi:MAG: carbohydrate binding domain-containing protein [Thermoguttaceae bacterium]